MIAGRSSVQRGTGTIEDRLKDLLSTSSSDIATKSNTDNPYEDGEMLKVPSQAPRQTTLPVDRVDVPALIEDDRVYPRGTMIPLHASPVEQRLSVNSTLSSSGYVPSNQSDRWSNHYTETPLDQPGRPSSATAITAPPMLGHENYGFLPDNLQTPANSASQNRATPRGGSSDLRAAWNRLYGQEGRQSMRGQEGRQSLRGQEVRPNSRPPPPYRHQPHVLVKAGQTTQPVPRTLHTPVPLHNGQTTPSIQRKEQTTPSIQRKEQTTPSIQRKEQTTPSIQRKEQTTPSIQRKGPPPTPPIRHQSNQRATETLTSQRVGNQSSNQNQNGLVAVQKLTEHDKWLTNNFQKFGAEGQGDRTRYSNDMSISKSGTITDDFKMANLSRTPMKKVNDSHDVTNIQSHAIRNSPCNQQVFPRNNAADRSGSYEDLDLNNGAQIPSSHSRSMANPLNPSWRTHHVTNISSNHLARPNHHDMDDLDDIPLAANDSIFDRNDLTPSEVSSRSATPPLPALSPSNTPPVSPPSSPTLVPKFPRSLSADMLSTPKAPDLLTSSKAGTSGNPRHVPTSELNWRKNSPREHATKFHQKRSKGSKNYHNSMLTGLRDSDEESFPVYDIDNTTLTVEPSPRPSQDTALVNGATNLRSMKHKVDGLEAMYSDLVLRLGSQRDSKTRGRRHSIGSSDTSSFRRVGSQFRHSTHKHRSRDLRSVNKRFQKLESHVVTLARSVAHLSSEMKSQNALLQEVERLRQEVKELRDAGLTSNKKNSALPPVPEFEKFRGWVPALTNPKRVKKLTKFFGQEPPLLEIFLRRLGYEKFATNFKNEHIGMVELPYMTEDRLKSIGIPMGPRLRILQEAQLCFRQENFDIYIV